MEFLLDYSIMMLSKKHRALSDVSYMYRSQAMLRTSACEQLSPKHKGHLTIKRRLSTSGKENRHLRTSLVCPRDRMLELKIRHNTFSRRGIICSILKLNRSAPDFGLQGQPIFFGRQQQSSLTLKPSSIRQQLCE